MNKLSLWWRKIRPYFPSTPKFLVQDANKWLEPIEGETRGSHFDYCHSVGRMSRYAWAPDYYVFNIKRGGFVDPRTLTHPATETA